MNPILHDLQNKQWVWTAANAKQEQLKQKRISGFDALDKVLSGGFPRAGMIHLNSPLGCGELRLMLSILEQQSTQDLGFGPNNKPEHTRLNTQANKQTSDHQKLRIFINPPFQLNAEFLLDHNIALEQLVVVQANTEAEALWSAEQSVKSGACDAVFIWHAQLNHTQVKKLELAATQGQSYCVWLQPLSNKMQVHNNLPLSLSLSIRRYEDQLNITVNKQKVGWAQAPVKVPLPFKSRTNEVFKQHRQVQANNVVPLQSNAHAHAYQTP
jgi:cell division inhibitor SulA